MGSSKESTEEEMKQSLKQTIIDGAMVFSFFWLFSVVIYGIYVVVTGGSELLSGDVLAAITFITLIIFVFFARCPDSYWNWYERSDRK